MQLISWMICQNKRAKRNEWLNRGISERDGSLYVLLFKTLNYYLFIIISYIFHFTVFITFRLFKTLIRVCNVCDQMFPSSPLQFLLFLPHYFPPPTALILNTLESTLRCPCVN